jgi:hypothetical protein
MNNGTIHQNLTEFTVFMRGLSAEHFTADDPYFIEAMLVNLSIVTMQAIINSGNAEANQRRATGQFMQLFEVGIPGLKIECVARFYLLACISDSTRHEATRQCRHQSFFAIATATADLAILADAHVPAMKPIDVHLRPDDSKYTWRSIGDERSLIVFSCEWKRSLSDHSMHQLAIDLCTAQSHRRALGMKDHKVYGAVGSQRQIGIYASEWSGEVRVPRLLHDYSQHCPDLGGPRRSDRELRSHQDDGDCQGSTVCT